MTRGRTPKPTHLKIIEGNPGKRRLPTNEPKPTPGRPTMPRGLSDEAKKVWRSLVPKLDALGLLTPVDQTALEVLCDAVTQYRAAMIYAAKGTLVSGRRKGEAVRNPALLEARQWAGVIGVYGSRFGLTPADRVRLATDGRDTFDDMETVLAADTWSL